MNKNFIPLEQALALKELGFNEPCVGYYNSNNEFVFFADVRSCNTNSEFGFHPTAPTLSQAFKWFREYQDLHSEILLDRTTYPKYCFEIHKYSDFGNYEKIEFADDWFLYKSYEEAELECLTRLIDIAKKNEK